MEFRLVYRGPLKANGGPVEKQAIRRALHGQLRELWTQVPLSYHRKDLLDPLNENSYIVQQVGDFQFAPLVSAKIHMIAELAITFLRPGPPGALIGSGGDLDNRIKTLFDALKIPKEVGEVPSGDTPGADETPFFCLVQDDVLITAISVTTDRLLEPANPGDVMLLIHVTVKASALSYVNMALVR